MCVCVWHIKIIAKTSVRELLPYVLSQEGYGIGSYVLVSHSFEFNFCEWYKMSVQFHFPTYDFPVSQHILLHWMPLASLLNISWP